MLAKYRNYREKYQKNHKTNRHQMRNSCRFFVFFYNCYFPSSVFKILNKKPLFTLALGGVIARGIPIIASANVVKGNANLSNKLTSYSSLIFSRIINKFNFWCYKNFAAIFYNFKIQIVVFGKFYIFVI